MSTRAHPLVLVVEDYQDAREMYAAYLQFSGYGVAEAANGIEAVEKAQELLPDIVLMDLALPRILIVLDDEDERMFACTHRRRAFDGSRSVKVEPRPASLARSIVPPSMFARRRQIERPRPVPPYPRVGDESSWRKSSNTFA